MGFCTRYDAIRLTPYVANTNRRSFFTRSGAFIRARVLHGCEERASSQLERGGDKSVSEGSALDWLD
jgi:hypothetical protein